MADGRWPICNIGRLAASQGLTALQQVDRLGEDRPEGKSDSHWIVMARNASDLAPLAADGRWSALTGDADDPPLDRRLSNILSVLRAR